MKPNTLKQLREQTAYQTPRLFVRIILYGMHGLCAALIIGIMATSRETHLFMPALIICALSLVAAFLSDAIFDAADAAIQQKPENGPRH